jgi:hypothetical protein
MSDITQSSGRPRSGWVLIRTIAVSDAALPFLASACLNVEESNFIDVKLEVAAGAWASPSCKVRIVESDGAKGSLVMQAFKDGTSIIVVSADAVFTTKDFIINGITASGLVTVAITELAVGITSLNIYVRQG